MDAENEKKVTSWSFAYKISFDESKTFRIFWWIEFNEKFSLINCEGKLKKLPIIFFWAIGIP